MNIIIILTGSVVGVAYLTELFVAWYSGVEYESYAFCCNKLKHEIRSRSSINKVTKIIRNGTKRSLLARSF